MATAPSLALAALNYIQLQAAFAVKMIFSSWERRNDGAGGGRWRGGQTKLFDGKKSLPFRKRGRRKTAIKTARKKRKTQVGGAVSHTRCPQKPPGPGEQLLFNRRLGTLRPPGPPCGPISSNQKVEELLRVVKPEIQTLKEKLNLVRCCPQHGDAL